MKYNYSIYSKLENFLPCFYSRGIFIQRHRTPKLCNVEASLHIGIGTQSLLEGTICCSHCRGDYLFPYTHCSSITHDIDYTNTTIDAASETFSIMYQLLLPPLNYMTLIIYSKRLVSHGASEIHLLVSLFGPSKNKIKIG